MPSVLRFSSYAGSNVDIWRSVEGQRIHHAKFGKGTILEVRGKDYLTFLVKFDRKVESATGSMTDKIRITKDAFDGEIITDLVLPDSAIEGMVESERAREEGQQREHQAQAKRELKKLKNNYQVECFRDKMTPSRFIQKFRVPCFYHFTDHRNLDSIRAHDGLLPLAELRRKKIPVPAPGGNEWSHDADARKGLDEYVHLCFFDEHPMAFRASEDGRIENPRFLKVHPSVLAFKGVVFAKDVSNKSGVRLLSLEEAIQVMDFRVIYEYTDWKEPEIKERLKEAKKYELLIPRRIPLELIIGGV